jgi:hypothetical protein
MTDLDIHAMTDRELLIQIAGKLNNTCDKVDKHDVILEGNGKWGIKTQVRILWLLACGLWSLAILVGKDFVSKH